MNKRTLWLIIPWALFVAAALGWVIYWFVLANAAEQRVRAWAAQQEAQGGEASFGRIVRHGFPVLLRLELQQVVYAPATGAWRMATDRADLHINPMNPAHVTAEAKAPIAFSRADGHVTNVSADALIATMRRRGAALETAGIEADNLALDDPAEDGVLHIEKLVLNVRPDPRAAGEYQAAFEARALTLPRPVRSFEAFGQDVAQLRAAIVIEHGAALTQSAAGDPLAPWRTAGGRLRFEALVLNWGPLETTGEGEGGLDDARRLQGALRFPLERPAPVLTALANGASVDENTRRAIGLLATGYALSGDDINLDIDANNGVLRIEGVSVRSLPPVY